MNKPIKPNITIPESFAENGIKTDFDDTLLADGFDSLRPDVLAGDNLNKFIDDTYKGLNYGIAAADAINLINEGETLTVKEGQLVSDKISGGTGLQLFDTILKDHILTYEETEGLALQGTYVYKEALAGSRYGYPDFYAKCLEEFNGATNTETINGVTVKIHSNGHKFYNIADKTAIDNFFNTTGLAWFYGIDTENERIFLPRDKYFAVKGDVSVAGNEMTIGLNNGSKNVGLSSYSYDFLTASGDAYGQPVRNSGDSDTSRTAGRFGLTLDPTKSGIEGKLTANEDKYLYICVGNTTNYEGLTDVVNQGMEILEQVNQGIESRVKLDGSNAEFVFITETYVNGTSWYRVYSDGWCEQGGYNNGNASSYTFLKPFRDKNYTILATSNSANNAGGIAAAYKNSNSQFTLHSTNNAFSLSWYACGYIV